jgi:hypothetical protein
MFLYIHGYTVCGSTYLWLILIYDTYTYLCLIYCLPELHFFNIKLHFLILQSPFAYSFHAVIKWLSHLLCTCKLLFQMLVCRQAILTGIFFVGFLLLLSPSGQNLGDCLK